MKKTLRKTLTALVATTLCVTLGLGTSFASSAQQVPNPAPETGLTGIFPANPDADVFGNYVAIGDSFTTTGPADNGWNYQPCWRSDGSFPRMLQSDLNANLDLSACAGARIVHYWQDQTQYLNEDTKLVTITMGANNVIDQSFNWNSAARDIKPDLEAMFADVRHRAPNAQIIAVGYYYIFADNDPVCLGATWVPAPLRQETTDVQKILNSTIAEAAAATGIEYMEPDQSKSACSPIGTRNMVLTGVPEINFGGHASLQGHRNLANQLLQRIRR